MTLVRTRGSTSAHTAADAADRGGPKVAHIATRYLRGGSERRIADIVRALPDAEHHLIVGTESDAELARSQIGSATLTVMPSLVRRPHPYLDAVALGRLIAMLRRGGYDVVVTHQSKAGVLGRAACRWTRIPAVHCLSMPSFGPGYPAWQSRLFRVIERRLGRNTDAFAVVGTDVARRYRAIGVPEDRLHVVRSGVPLPAPGDGAAPNDDVRRRHALPADRPIVLYLGSLEPRKNVLDLPPLLGDLLRSMPDRPPFLAIAGDGPLASPIQEALEDARLSDHATYLGYVEDALALVGASDVVVLLSEAEGVPQVLVQASALGTPFVAYDVDGVGELIDLGADGVAVTPGDLAGATAAVLATLRRRRRRATPAIDLTPWHPDSIAEGYRSVFARVLRSPEGVTSSTRTERLPTHV